MDVTIAIFEGVDELDAIGPYEVFQKATEEGADFDVSLRTLGPADGVTASHGLVIEPDGRLDERPDLLVVPGGGWNAGDGSGARAEAERGALPEAIADAHDTGTTLAAVCTGSMLLAHAGLLEGRPATTHAGARSELREMAGEVVDARVVDDGDVLTAGGVTAGIDLALHLVEREAGADVAERVRTRLEHGVPSSVYRPE